MGIKVDEDGIHRHLEGPYRSSRLNPSVAERPVKRQYNWPLIVSKAWLIFVLLLGVGASVVGIGPAATVVALVFLMSIIITCMAIVRVIDDHVKKSFEKDE